MRHYFVCLLLLTATSVAIAAGDPVAGKDKALICTGCHGLDGNNDNSEYPILAGQKHSYLLKQLKDFKSGARVDDHMTSMVLAVEESDFEDIATYFSNNEILTKSGKTVSNNPGKKIFTEGVDNKDILACSNCHGSDATGNVKEAYPSLASQHKEYLIKQLKNFQNSERHNDTDKIMRNIAAKLSDKEIEAIADYLSRLDK